MDKKEYQKQYKEKNKEKLREYNRNYYEKHKINKTKRKNLFIEEKKNKIINSSLSNIKKVELLKKLKEDIKKTKQYNKEYYEKHKEFYIVLNNKKIKTTKEHLDKLEKQMLNKLSTIKHLKEQIS